MNPKAPAFPSEKGQPVAGVGYTPASGLLIRDYIAIEAMKGLIPCAHKDGILSPVVARKAYRMADALIAESKKQ